MKTDIAASTFAPPLVAQSFRHPERTAIIDIDGEYTYQTLHKQSALVAAHLLNGATDLKEARVAFLTPRGFEYVVMQWAIWRAGGIAVPLCEAHPTPELAYVIDDTAADIVIAHPKFAAVLEPIAAERNVRYLLTTELYSAREVDLPKIDADRAAMILYTSGTTGKPKGVVTTHRNIEAQVSTLISAWEWRSDDVILNVLPLHHTHGIINVLCCAMWAGAACEILPKFDAAIVWQRLASGDLTLFMAVPTIYARLIRYWEEASPDTQQVLSDGCAKLRLMVSGSAALPVSRLEAWQRISGHTLLERYGMTEINMALSNALHGKRIPGAVGKPLPSVVVRIVDEQDQEVDAGTSGELQVKGPSVFREYFRKPEATEAAFCDGWFRTGDIVIEEDGVFRILGRNSVDIIKTGGYKVSALEIEEVLRTHTSIQDCAVVGVPDDDWGECVCAALTLSEEADLTLDNLRTWGKDLLAPYKVPSDILILDDLPRNVLGKVTKPQVVVLFEQKQTA